MLYRLQPGVSDPGYINPLVLRVTKLACPRASRNPEIDEAITATQVSEMILRALFASTRDCQPGLDLRRCRAAVMGAVLTLGLLPLLASARTPSLRPEHDLVLEEITTDWSTGGFVGNGLIGAMLYRDEQRPGVRVEIGRTDVADHRPEFGVQYGRFRLPIGRFVIEADEPVESLRGRIDLQAAEVILEARTKTQVLRVRAFAHARRDVLGLEWSGAPARVSFEPELSVSPRYHRPMGLPPPAGYTPNPPAVQRKLGEVHTSYQPLLAGGSYTTAWQEVADQPGVTRLWVAIGYSHPQDLSERAAVQAVEAAVAQPVDALRATHREWWREFFARSGVALPDPELERFWWVQQYKLGSAMRADGPPLDLMGPWYRHTPWAAYWHNLNTQLTYYPVFSSNRVELAESLFRALDNNVDRLIQNVPPPFRHDSAALGRKSALDFAARVDLENPRTYPRGEPDTEVGNLTWLLHVYWLGYRHTMDDALLRDRLFPLLRRAINFYLHLLEEGPDGALHLPRTFSPEYPGGFTRDCTYDLALLRWGCRALLEADARLALQDPLAARWQHVLDRLTPYAEDENGFMIGRDLAFARSHRHYSHLMMWYPLHVLEPTAANLERVRRTVAHWHSFPGALEGYSFTGGASMHAKLGEGAVARDHLRTLLRRFIRPNTMYLEAGPVIETPLSAVSSINELLLQSWDGVLRIFPAVPEDWREAAFRDLRAEGAFVVSAERREGRTRWVRVESLAGEPCELVADLAPPVQIRGVPPERVERVGDRWRIALARGEAVELETAEGR